MYASSEVYQTQYQSNYIANSLPSSIYKKSGDYWYWEILTSILFAAKYWKIAKENLAQKEYGFVFSSSLQLAKQVRLIYSIFKSWCFQSWEILTAGQKLLNRNVLWRDLQSSQSSKANIILATSETARGAWGKKKKRYYQGSAPASDHVVECAPSLWETTWDENPLRLPDVGDGRLGLYSQEVVLIMLTRPQST